MFSSPLKAVLVGTLLAVSVSALTDSERAAVLDSHNSFRQQIANGEAVNKDGTKLPTAANMLKLSYDPTMEVAAQQWADNCTGTVNSGGNVPYGQGSCWTYPQVSTMSMLTTHGTERFYKALSELGVDPDMHYPQQVGQWTQLAWAETSRLGCGVAQCPANQMVPKPFTFIVCYYGPSGNVQGENIYEPGTPCSQCPAKTVCSSGLCANSSEATVTTTPKAATTTTTLSATTTTSKEPTTTALPSGCATAPKLIELDAASNSTILTTAINNAYNGWVRTAKVNFASYKKRIENIIWGDNSMTAQAKLDEVQWVLSDCASQQNVYAIQISSWGTVADLVACRGTTTTKAGPGVSTTTAAGTIATTTKAPVPMDTTTTKASLPDTTTKATVPADTTTKAATTAGSVSTTTTKVPVPADTTTTTTKAPTTAVPVSTSTTKLPVADTTTTTKAPEVTSTKAPAPVTTAATSTTTKAPVADATTTKVPVPDTTTSSTPTTTSTAPSSVICPLSSNTDSFRQQLLDLHNQFRRDMANGLAPNKTGFLPKGQNIYKLDYSCDLEANIGDVCTTGSRRSSSVPYTRQQIEQFLIDSIKSQWNQSVVYGVDASISKNINTSRWADLAADRLTKLGCAVADCGLSGTMYKVAYTCAYDFQQYPFTRTPYVPGPPCTKDSDCTRMPNSICLASEGLCKETSVYPAPGVNTMCPGVTSPLDDRARMRAVDLHNVNRKNLIHGMEPMGNMNTFAPTGSNMYKMVWDCGVEAKAQEWANNDKFPGHSTWQWRTYDGMPHGENMMGGGLKQKPFYLLDYASTLFWDELVQHGWLGVGNHTLTQADFDATIGHWSQMAWAETYQLGCGISPSNIVVCQYGPSGNYLGPRTIYPSGVPCKTNADCTLRAGDTCNAATGLCVRS